MRIDKPGSSRNAFENDKLGTAEAQDALRTSEGHLRTVLEGIGEAFYVLDRDWRFVFASKSALRMWRKTPQDLMRRPFLDCFPKAEGSDAYAAHVQVMQTRAAVRIETVSPILERWIEVEVAPVSEGGLSVAFRDIDDRKRAEAALRESEARFQQFAAASSGALWIRDADTLAMEYVSPAIARIYGVVPDEFLGDTPRWAELILPEDRDAALEHIEQAREGKSVVNEFRIRRPSNGAIRWIRDTKFPLHDALGRIQRIGGIAEDITETKNAAERQRLLLAELQHRVRNVLATIRSLVSRTTRSSNSLEELSMHLTGRIDAMARTQVMLTRNPGKSVDLDEIVREELLAQGGLEERVSIEGKSVELSPKAAEVVTLALHELTTNSFKYGALLGDKGRIAIVWRIERRQKEDWLRLAWVESEVKILSVAPRHEGFGTELITRRVPYELSGTGSLDLRPGGVHAVIQFPLRPGRSILQSDDPTAK